MMSALADDIDIQNFKAAIRQALQETMFQNALGINPRQLREVVEQSGSCFQHFAGDGETGSVEAYGQKLATLGMGHRAVLALVQSINLWCSQSAQERLREIGLHSRFSTPLLAGYIQAREQHILVEQERTRVALDQARGYH